MGSESTGGVGIEAPAPSYREHRQRLIAAGFPTAAGVVFVLIAIYAVPDLYKSARPWEVASYAAELAIPLLALLLARSVMRNHVEGVVLLADFAFTAVLTARLLIPSTTLSGTALFLSLKMVATALLWAWHPAIQFLASTFTLGAFAVALAISGRMVDESHQVIGPLIGAGLAGIGALLTDRTRRDAWRQQLALSAAEQRARALLASERTLAAIAREVCVLSDLPTVLDRVNSLTATALGSDFSITYLIDARRAEIAAAASNASDPALRAQILAVRAPLDLPVVAELLAGRTIVINDPAAQPWFDVAQLQADGVRRLALTPISAKGVVVGVLTITRTAPGSAPFDERHVGLLEAIAAQAAIAIENARLFEGLAASEASYRDLFERATDLIFVVDEHGGIRFANQAALDFVGLTAEGLHGKRWHELVSEDSRRALDRRTAIARRRGIAPERAFEIEVCPTDGRPATLEIRARRIGAVSASPLYQCIARDVTERRRQEREREQLLFRLREANRLQAEFVANMSHELRTPLNVIIGYADLLADEPTLPRDSDARLFLERISAGGRALHRLVESVLEYARLDRGRSVVIRRRFPVTELLRELRELGIDVRGSAPIELVVQEQSDLVFDTDFDRLYSILSNLLLNAIKFTTAGYVELSVRRDGSNAEFVVRDTGIGIEADELAHVFEPFRQVDGSPTRSFGGVGLGLAIVRRNAQLLRGAVEVDSQLGVGTTFRVRIPLAFADDAAHSSAA